MSSAEFSARLSRLNDPRILAVWFAVWLVCGVIVAIGIGLADSSNQRLFRALNEHGISVQARVTATRPQDHDTVFYAFDADGRTYRGADSAGPPNPDASHLSTGDHIAVVYDARDPNTSCACDRRDSAKASRWWRRLIAGLFGGAVISLVITLNLEPRVTRLLDRLRGARGAPSR